LNKQNNLDFLQRDFYAHSIPGEEKQYWQKLDEHLKNTARIAFELGKDSKLSNLASMAGLLHDIGNYSTAFQKRLQ